MTNLLDIATWQTGAAELGARLSESAGQWLPRIVVSLIVLALGWGIARIAQASVRRVLGKARVGRFVRSARIAESLREAGVDSSASDLLARLVFWAMLILAALLALQSVGVTSVGKALESIAAFVPNLLTAIVIAALGIPLVRLLRSLVTSAAAAANLARASQLGAGAQAGAIVLLAVLVLGQVGVDTELLVALIVVLMGTFSLAMGLAFAMGARPVVTHILAGHFLRQQLTRGLEVEVMGFSGKVKSVGALSTVLTDGEQEWMLPNAKVLDEVVRT